jgi:hypothetical protein
VGLLDDGGSLCPGLGHVRLRQTDSSISRSNPGSVKM